MAQHNELGHTGEELAKQYLVEKGYLIRDCNWRSGKYELDIVAEYGNTLVVVEVKTRSNELFARPFDAVDEKKIRRTVMAASSYVFKYRINLDVRFDIIGIIPE
ncbi:MAG: YraN family protein, partial [Bacteroidales bacterium]|nr:YraN family protein [Bacteroidales bacterium]